MRDLWTNHPGIKEAVDLGHITAHYFTSHRHLNVYGFIPKGGERWWEQPPAAPRPGAKPVKGSEPHQA